MKLYDWKPAPSPRRARIFIAEKNIQGIEYVQVDLGKGEQFADWFKEKNPRCAVPVLELDDGTCISESAAICRYFEEMQEEPNLLGRDIYEKSMIQMWLSRIEQQLWFPIGLAFRHGTDFFKGVHEQVAEIVPYAKSKAEQFMDFLDQHLVGKEYISCDRFSAADINAFVAIDFGRPSDIRVGERKHLAAWYQRIADRPSSKA